MEKEHRELLDQLTALLDHAQALAARLSGRSDSRPPTTLDPNTLATLEQRCQQAERRANVAEVRVAKLTRELEVARHAGAAEHEEMQRLAYQDPLTGLGNAHLLTKLLDKLVGQANHDALLLVVDVDRFSVINQMLGHDLGDDLLIRLAERLSSLADAQTAVGRLSEDEFGLVVSHLPLPTGPARAAQLAQAVRAKLEEPFLLQGQRLALTVSQGGALTSGPAESARDLFAEARQALAVAKQSGRNQFQLYTPDLDQRLRRDATLEFHLKYGLQNDEFFLEYLPTIAFQQGSGGSWHGKVTGVEALLRWNHRTEGVIRPNDFLPAAERSGHILAIGERVLQQVCHDVRQWSSQGLQLFVNVNLSGRQLLALDFVERATALVQEGGVPFDRLTFEFHETFSQQEEESISGTLSRLHQAGFRLALNAFGEGSTSLRRLSQVTFVKLSTSLLASQLDLARQALVVASALGKVAIGVGAETTEQARFLCQHGCSMVQGFHFSRPLPAAELLELCQRKPTWKL